MGTSTSIILIFELHRRTNAKKKLIMKKIRGKITSFERKLVLVNFEGRTPADVCNVCTALRFKMNKYELEKERGRKKK